MKNRSPLASVPVRTAGSTGSTRSRATSAAGASAGAAQPARTVRPACLRRAATATNTATTTRLLSTHPSSIPQPHPLAPLHPLAPPAPAARRALYYLPMLLRLKRLDPTVALPAPATGGAAGFDLAAADDVEVPPRQIRLIGTGLVIGVPSGYFLGIFARSSTPLKRGLIVANGVGVVDADYCGPGGRGKGAGAQHHRRARPGPARRPHRAGHRPAGAGDRVGRSGGDGDADARRVWQHGIAHSRSPGAQRDVWGRRRTL